ncbi:unnamed protein product [Dovyalis caffra]|uniref:Uncharacterized protein n=1 Tax=Dovyalis caffra TaxID=77055 RepID=A0AAV1RW08_9ROSI|nr:unnamed protein product [Dovyalis caffra]
MRVRNNGWGQCLWWFEESGLVADEDEGRTYGVQLVTVAGARVATLMEVEDRGLWLLDMTTFDEGMTTRGAFG